MEEQVLQTMWTRGVWEEPIKIIFLFTKMMDRSVKNVEMIFKKLKLVEEEPSTVQSVSCSLESVYANTIYRKKS